MNLLDRFKKLEIGTPVLLKIKTISDKNFYKNYIYNGNIKQSGYITKDYAWCQYEIPGVIKKAYFVEFINIKYKTKSIFLIDVDVIDFDILEEE